MSYTEKEFVKRGYYFTPELLNEWEIFHLPSKDFSPSAAAAFLAYMVLEPQIRDTLRKLAFQKDVKKTRLEARKIIREVLADAYRSGYIGIHSPEDKQILIEGFSPQIQTLNIRFDIKSLEKIAGLKDPAFSVVYKILNPDEQKMVDEIRAKLGPDDTGKKKIKSA